MKTLKDTEPADWPAGGGRWGVLSDRGAPCGEAPDQEA